MMQTRRQLKQRIRELEALVAELEKRIAELEGGGKLYPSKATLPSKQTYPR